MNHPESMKLPERLKDRQARYLAARKTLNQRIREKARATNVAKGGS